MKQAANVGRSAPEAVLAASSAREFYLGAPKRSRALGTSRVSKKASIEMTIRTLEISRPSKKGTMGTLGIPEGFLGDFLGIP